jgi:hypothetical protein
MDVDDELLDDEVEQIEPTELLTREQFLSYENLQSNIKADIMWAYQALGAEGLKPEDAPSPGAWFIYATAKDSDLARKSFMTGPLTKLLPTKAQMEKEDRAEDGRKHFGIIEKLLRERDDAAPVLSDTEKRARELALSRAGS